MPLGMDALLKLLSAAQSAKKSLNSWDERTARNPELLPAETPSVLDMFPGGSAVGQLWKSNAAFPKKSALSWLYGDLTDIPKFNSRELPSLFAGIFDPAKRRLGVGAQWEANSAKPLFHEELLDEIKRASRDRMPAQDVVKFRYGNFGQPSFARDLDITPPYNVPSTSGGLMDLSPDMSILDLRRIQNLETSQMREMESILKSLDLIPREARVNHLPLWK